MANKVIQKIIQGNYVIYKEVRKQEFCIILKRMDFVTFLEAEMEYKYYEDLGYTYSYKLSD